MALNPQASAICLICGVPLQRTPEGDLEAGIAAHFQYVHPDEEPPQ